MQLLWTVYDCLNQTVIGIWPDIVSAETFYHDNTDPHSDLWSVFPLDEIVIY